MYNTYLMANDFNVGIYIRLSQEDKIKNIKLIVKVLIIKKNY